MMHLRLNVEVTDKLFPGERLIDDSPVIIIDGNELRLAVDVETDIFIPCSRCVVSNICSENMENSFWKELCFEYTPNSSGYWVLGRTPHLCTVHDIRWMQDWGTEKFLPKKELWKRPFYNGEFEVRNKKR